MVELEDTHSGNLSSLQWMTTVAFLGALYCIVLGIFKRFTANFSLGGGRNDEPGAVQPRMGVYRNFEYTTYKPVYTQIDEVQSGSTLPAQANIGYPKTELKPSGVTGNNIGSGTSSTKVHGTSSQGLKDIRKPASPGLPKSHAPMAPQPNRVKSIKGAAPPKPPEDKAKDDDNKKKLEKQKKEEKANEEKLKKEKAAQLKKDKELKEKRDKEEKAMKEKEAKAQKEKAKLDKDKSKKGKAPSKPVAAATLVEPVNVSLTTPKNLPPYSKTDPKSKILGSKNLTGSMQELSATPVAVNNTFTSSWDLVAEHRQNMQRELRTPNPGRNLRSIASQGTNNSTDFNAPTKSASKGFTTSRRFSGDSDMSNTDA